MTKIYHINKYNEHSTKYGKYIGKHVIAGGELNGIRGHIVYVTTEHDEILGDCTWFHIKDEHSGIVERYAKEEIREIVPQIQEVYVEL